MKIVIKSEPNNWNIFTDQEVYEVTAEEVAIMIDATFELQKQELEDPSQAQKRSIQEFIEDLNKPEINNPKRFRDNTVSGQSKNSRGDYEDREYESSEGLNYLKRPRKDKTIDQPGGALHYDHVPGRPKSSGFYFEDKSFEKNERAKLLHQAIQYLPSKDQDLIYQIHFEGCYQADVARAEGVSRPAINKRLNRAERKLK